MSRRRYALSGLLGSLAACIQAPPSSDALAPVDTDLPTDTAAPCVDLDDDGHCEPVDCDDDDPAVNPDASERCATVGVDDDCDGLIDDLDDGFVGGLEAWTDGDQDGYGAGEPFVTCAIDLGESADDTDCDDLAAAVNPGMSELCATVGADDNCDELIDLADPTVSDAVATYLDLDLDGYGVGAATMACAVAAGSSAVATDCDDADPYVHPGAVALCDGRQNDCDEVDWPVGDTPGAVSHEALDGSWADLTNAFATPPFVPPADGTVWLCDGAYVTEVTATAAASTTLAARNVGSATLIGTGTGAVVSVTAPDAELVVRDVAITGGAGGVFQTDGQLTVLGCVIGTNTAATGAGVYHGGGNLELRANFITGNVASGAGGGLASVDDGALGSVTIVDTTFDANHATGAGGGVSLAGPHAYSIEGGSFDGNTSAAPVGSPGGGGLAVSGGATASVVDAAFVGNTATGAGGGIEVFDASVTLDAVTVLDNLAAQGGGIDVIGALDLIGSTVAGNDATGAGGGLFLLLSEPGTVTDSDVESNSADRGGGLFVADLSQAVDVVDTRVGTNTATRDGGGAFLEAALTCTAPAVADLGFAGNAAAIGGAVFVGRGGRLESAGCDWGLTAEANAPQDVRTVDSARDWEFVLDDDFVCDPLGCVGPGADTDADGATARDGDCDDLEPRAFPGNTEVWDGVDNDCDLTVDQAISFGDAAIVLEGEATGDQLGAAVATGGDLDGDGTADLALGAPRFSLFGVQPDGRVYLYAGGSLPAGVTPVHTEAAAIITGPPNWELGSAVALASDLDGDGFHDLAIGSPKSGAGGTVHVFYGSGTPIWLGTPNLVDAALEFTTSTNGGAGATLASGGDLDADGLDDLLVGAPDGSSGGLVYAISGDPTRPGAIDETHASVETLVGEGGADQAGRRLAIVPDGVGAPGDEALIGAPGLGVGGRAYLVEATDPDDGVDLLLSDVGVSAGAQYDGTNPTARLGEGLATGDLDGDGRGDWAVAETGAGQVHVWYSSGYAPALAPGPIPDVTLSGGAPSDEVGFALAIGDLNGDGANDLAVGLPATPGGGGVLVFYGPLSGAALTPLDADVSFASEGSADRAGHAIAIGDPNGDGCADLVVGAPAWGPFDRGRVYVQAGCVD